MNHMFSKKVKNALISKHMLLKSKSDLHQDINDEIAKNNYGV